MQGLYADRNGDGILASGGEASSVRGTNVGLFPSERAMTCFYVPLPRLSSWRPGDALQALFVMIKILAGAVGGCVGPCRYGDVELVSRLRRSSRSLPARGRAGAATVRSLDVPREPSTVNAGGFCCSSGHL